MSKEPKRNVYVGHRYVPKIMGEWDKQQSYEGLSIVTHQGTSYTSKKHVPVGIDILDEEYWVVTGNYNAQVETYRQEVRDMMETVTTLNQGLDMVNDKIDQGLDTVNDKIEQIATTVYPSNGDDYNSLQNAFDRGGVINFPSGVTTPFTISKPIKITKSVKIMGNDNLIQTLTNDVFVIENDLEHFEMVGLNFDAPNDVGGVETYAVRCNGRKVIGKYFVEKNNFKHLILEVNLKDNPSRNMIKISENEWSSNEGLYMDRVNRFGYLHISTNMSTNFYGNPYPVFNGGVITVVNNNFNVYSANTTNEDIIKIDGNMENVYIAYNNIINTNKNAGAQVDTFNGGHKLKFLFNNLKNVRFTRKEEKGVTQHVYNYSHDIIAFNTVEFDPDAYTSELMFFQGSMFKVLFNTIISRNRSTGFTAIFIGDSDNVYDEFGTIHSTNFLVEGNTVDIRSNVDSPSLSMYPIQVIGDGTGKILNNNFLGGTALNVNDNKEFNGNDWTPHPSTDEEMGVRVLDSLKNCLLGKENRIIGHEGVAKKLDELMYKSVTLGLSSYQEVDIDEFQLIEWTAYREGDTRFRTSDDRTVLRIPRNVRKVRLTVNVSFESAVDRPYLEFRKNGNSNFIGNSKIALSGKSDRLSLTSGVIDVMEGDEIAVAVRQRDEQPVNLLDGLATLVQLEVIA